MKKYKSISVGPRLTQRDLPILRFLWRWKVATTGALMAYCYPEYRWTPATTHWRLNRLRQMGFVDRLHVWQDRPGSVWVPTEQTFNLLREELPELREKGFRSDSIYHDLVIQAVSLGGFLPMDSISKSQIATEQELRRIEPDCLPDWVPRVKQHRPDGFWNLSRDKTERIVALEIELSSKTYEQYRMLGCYFNTERTINEVLWVVSVDGIARRVQQAMANGPYPFRDIHQFVRLSDFLKSGWQAEIFSGMYRGQKIASFVNKNGSNYSPTNPSLGANHDWVSTILDCRTRRINSITSVIKPNTTESVY